MSGKVAVRNVRLCEKDCLCLYVCPTGASDTENSVIDREKCIGCGACAEACPANAISLVPREYPPQQKKTEEVIAALRHLVHSKARQETIAAGLPGPLAEAVGKSCRIMAEDLLREAGYMLPQSANVRALLEDMLSRAAEPGFPKEAAELLLGSLEMNEPSSAAEEKREPARMRKCSVCGYIHEGALPEGFRCPVCGQSAAALVKLEAEAARKYRL